MRHLIVAFHSRPCHFRETLDTRSVSPPLPRHRRFVFCVVGNAAEFPTSAATVLMDEKQSGVLSLENNKRELLVGKMAFLFAGC